jgi:hypothetical protein
MRLSRLTGCLLVATAAAHAAQAQAPAIRVAGRLQVQYRSASGDSTSAFNTNTVLNGFEIRRLRIQTDVRFGDLILMVAQPSLEMAALRMRDAYVRVGFTRQFGITMGQEKTPFLRYELNSSNTLPSIERGIRINGLSGREATDDILVNNGYAAHDIGATVDFATTGSRFTAKAGVVNGSRESSTDVNNGKSYVARITGIPLLNKDDQPMLQLGLSFASRDRAVCNLCTGTLTWFVNQAVYTQAYGADFEWGGFRPGLHVFADFATGDNVPLALRATVGRNTANLRATTPGNIVTFRAFNIVAAWRHLVSTPESGKVVQFVEPTLRVDYTDPNTGVANDHGILITPVFNVYFTGTVVARAGLDLYFYTDALGTARSVREFKLSWQANF